jgi:hypothetical protein
MPPDNLETPRTCGARLVPSALVCQALNYRGAYWLIANWPPQKNSTQHATGWDWNHSYRIIRIYACQCQSKYWTVQSLILDVALITTVELSLNNFVLAYFVSARHRKRQAILVRRTLVTLQANLSFVSNRPFPLWVKFWSRQAWTKISSQLERASQN